MSAGSNNYEPLDHFPARQYVPDQSIFDLSDFLTDDQWPDEDPPSYPYASGSFQNLLHQANEVAESGGSASLPEGSITRKRNYS